MIAVLIDSALFSLLYPLAFHYRFGSWPGFSLPLTWLLEVWLLASYVLGRYHSHLETSWAQAVDQLSRSLAALLLCIGLYLAYYWLTATAFGAEDSRGFLLPVLLGFAALSSLAQAVLAALLQGGQKAPHQWLLLGSADLASELEHQMAWSRLRVDVAHPTPHPWPAGLLQPPLWWCPTSRLWIPTSCSNCCCFKMVDCLCSACWGGVSVCCNVFRRSC